MVTLTGSNLVQGRPIARASSDIPSWNARSGEETGYAATEASAGDVDAACTAAAVARGGLGALTRS